MMARIQWGYKIPQQFFTKVFKVIVKSYIENCISAIDHNATDLKEKFKDQLVGGYFKEVLCLVYFITGQSWLRLLIREIVGLASIISLLRL